MKKVLRSNRLLLQPLQLEHAEFLRALVNTPDWIRFIGIRNVDSSAAALHYTRSIIDNPKVSYWTVLLPDSNTSIGIISLVKREYLEYPDLGFAFLPEYSGKGYAFEAATAVLKALLASGQYRILLAVTMSQNTRAIALLERLHFAFVKDLIINGENFRVYSISNLT